MTLTLDDTAKLGKMLAEYEQATREKSIAATGIPERLYIADDIVSQALDDLLHDWLAMREIVQAVAATPDYRAESNNLAGSPTGLRYVFTVYSDTNLIEKARALLAKERPKPAPELYRIVWWQSLIVGLAQGETVEENVPLDKVNERVAYWRISFAGGIGVMVGSCPMSFVPEGDRKEAE